MQSFTPGWNDPPSLRGSSSSTSSTTSSVRNLLNKRVAFPISGDVNVPQTAPGEAGLSAAPIAPPSVPVSNSSIEQSLPASNPIQSNSQVSESAPAETPIEDNISDSMQFTPEEILQVLRSALAAGGTIQAPTIDNISKRLDKLQQALEKSSISPFCSQKLNKLVQAMKEERYTDAYNIHSAMMVEHFAEVNQWMVGVKALILECQKRAAS